MRPRVPLLHHSTCCSRCKPTPQHGFFIFSPPVFEFKFTVLWALVIGTATRCTPVPSPYPAHALLLSRPMTSRKPLCLALTRRRCQNPEQPLSDALQTTQTTEPRPAVATALHLVLTKDDLPSECLGHVALVHQTLPLHHTQALAFACGRRATISTFAGIDRLVRFTKIHFSCLTMPK